MSWRGAPLEDFLANAFGTSTLSGEWATSEDLIDLEVTLRDLGGGSHILPGPESHCDEQVWIPIEITVSVGDSLVASDSTEVRLPASDGDVTLTGVSFDSGAFTHPERWPNPEYDTGGVTLTLSLESSSGVLTARSARVEWDLRTIGEFGEGRQPLHHFPAPEVVADCSLSEPLEDSAFADEDSVIAGITGRWALCDAERRLPFAGIEIRADRTWYAIEGGSGLKLSMGFEREGIVRLHDISQMNGVPGPQYQLNLAAPGWSFAAFLRRRSQSGNTVDLDRALLVRLTSEVTPADPPAFGTGVRAGAAGCMSTETEFEEWPADAAQLQSTLAGSWVICSGGSGRVRFDAQGHVEFFDAEGRSLRKKAYSVQTGSLGTPLPYAYAEQVMIGDEGWQAIRTTRPVKLQLSQDEGLEGDETLVLSAEPE